MSNNDYIEIFGAEEHNLKNIDIRIPKNKLVVVTGPSGSGKSSLAFDTLYAEGQRRYVDSLSSYARYFLDIQDKPLVRAINGLMPSIAIDQKVTAKNPRSTVGTMTEIYDHLRLLFTRIGTVYSPKTNLPLKKYNIGEIAQIIFNLPLDTKVRVYSPVVVNAKTEFIQRIKELKDQKHEKVRLNNKIVDLATINFDTIPEVYTIEIIIDRIIVKSNIEQRVLNSIERAFSLSSHTVVIEIVELPDSKDSLIINNDNFYNGLNITCHNKYICRESGFVIEELESKIFSFNSPFGACKACNGLGTEVFFKEELIIPDPDLSLADGAIEPWRHGDVRYNNQLLYSLSKFYNFDIKTPYKNLPDNIKKILLYGNSGEKFPFIVEEEFKKYTIERDFKGVIYELNEKLEASDDDPLLVAECEKYQTLTDCHVCSGYRLKQESLQVKINDRHIGHIASLSIEALYEWIVNLYDSLSNDNKLIANLLLQEIKNKLSFLINVGVEYLTLNRSSNTLSGGEAQRIRLATQIASGLSGVLYVLDEPSIGLHQSDNIKLISTLRQLCNLGNSVIVIEHDEETMRSADYIVDVGPGAGKYGGEIVASGTVEEIMQNKNSLTGLFLSGALTIPVPKARRRYGKNDSIVIKNAKEHNLKNIDATIPLGMFVCVAGVSGGGKSTLVIDILYTAASKFLNGSKNRIGKCDAILGLENLDKIIKIDQLPIGRTPRSNPATYIGLFSLIRDIFTALPLSRRLEYKNNRFSFNVKGGRCEACQGDGTIKVEMDFLPDVYIPCSVCHGKRYNKDTLEVKYKGYSIADILEADVRSALEIFEDIPTIKEKLLALYNVGLDYIKLGQSSLTLSGGEAQRIKLAKELSKKATGNTLYILDEPTTGLHSCDIQRLLEVLHTLVDYGNTVVVIEHNLDVIKTADYVMDIGPKGGEKGGRIVACGTPEEVAKNPESVTGKYLAAVLNK